MFLKIKIPFLKIFVIFKKIDFLRSIFLNSKEVYKCNEHNDVSISNILLNLEERLSIVEIYNLKLNE